MWRCLPAGRLGGGARVCLKTPGFGPRAARSAPGAGGAGAVGARPPSEGDAFPYCTIASRFPWPRTRPWACEHVGLWQVRVSGG